MPRKIVHIDLDAFFCAVEELHNPSLHGKPFAVGGRPDERGVVASCSYAARRFGVHSAMPMARALKLCPQLIVISSRHGEYSRISHQVMERLQRFTPLLEQISIDEAFLDVSDLPADGLAIAKQIQDTIHQELNLPCSLGVASNKLVAKIATDVGKAAGKAASEAAGRAAEHSLASPNAITVVPPGKEAAFLAPLPVEALWGVGPKTAARLAELGVTTIGDLAHLQPVELKKLFGKNGQELARRALGVDNRPIVTSYEIKSISQETTFARDINRQAELHATLQELSASVGARLRKSDWCGSTVRLKIRWADFTTHTRQMTLSQPTDQDGQIYIAALHLFSKIWLQGRPVRLLGVGVSHLSRAPRQLSLWDNNSQKERRLHSAVDALREKYGEDVFQRKPKDSQHRKE
jgi:DNA polymerase-4